MRTLHSCIFKISLLAALCLFLQNAGQAQHTISGRLTSAAGEPLPGVVVYITGSTNTFVISDTAGNYQASLPAGGAYNVKPYSNAQPLNGVSTFDLVLMVRHISGVQPFTSPYQYIAADSDNNGIIDLQDSLTTRDLILFTVTNFPNNTSWRFVRSDYVFPDPTNPFQPPYPETYGTPNLDADVSNVDFIGVKIGDLNGSVVLKNLTDSTHLSWINGTVARDDNGNCQYDSGEAPLIGWVVQAIGQFGNFYGKTNLNGTYSVAGPPGTYDITVFPPNDLWDPCTATQTGVTTSLQSQTTVDFPIGVDIECPAMQVDLSAPFLRRCFPNTYTVYYCNQGTVTAEDAYVEVAFDTFLIVQSSTIPWTSVNGNTYTFDIGDVPSGQCSSFRVTVLVSCDASLGQTHCSSAQIYPDTVCSPPPPLWNGAQLEVNGHCNNDEVVFTIKNTGAPMTEAVEYVVIEDIMIQMSSGVQLDAGQSETITLPANGATWRLEVDQAPNHPWSTLPSATVEGCGVNGSGTFSTGFVTLFPLGDESRSLDIDCQENRASYDPNDKQGLPRGVQDAHYIPKGQDLTYKIRFQNTGTDTAFNIVVLDTLSDLLDLRTLRTGASSHPYTWNLLGDGVIQFLFQNILLPDSNVNEPLSHGFVQFSVKPLPDLPNNSIVENSAAIYFDFNEPVVTNQTWHTIGEQYLDVSMVVFQPGIDLEVYPNPAVHRTWFQLKSPRPLQGQLLLFDLQGRQTHRQNFQSNGFELQTGDLAPGLYFFRIESEGLMLAVGKLVVAGR